MEPKKKQAEPLPAGCAECRGCSHVPALSGGVERCTCARGKALAAMDWERRHPHKRAGIGFPDRKRKQVYDGRAAGAGGER